MMNLIEIALSSGIVVPAASSEGDGALIFWLLGPAAGIGYYSWMYLRYRNSDKRHQYERETDSTIVDLKTYDQRVSSVKGVRRSQIENANSSNPLLRLGRGTTVTVVPAPEPAVLPPRADQPVQPVDPSLHGAPIQGAPIQDAPMQGSTPSVALPPQQPPAPPTSPGGP